MRLCAIVPAIFLLLASDTQADSDDALRASIRAGKAPARVVEAKKVGYCREGTDYCDQYVDRLIVLRNEKRIAFMRDLRRWKTRPIRLVEHAPDGAAELPEIDWNPGGYEVFRAGKRWGTCLWFSHEGLGKSGHFQRWGTIVLVPWKGNEPGPVAHRFVGYWPSCNDLVEGEKEGEIALPTIEIANNDPQHLSLIWNQCTLRGCTRVKDFRTITGSSDSGSGALRIQGE